jgi:hypothetical protein
MPLMHWLSCVAPVLAWGGFTQMLLNMNGRPLGEWVFPATATAVLAACVPNRRVRFIGCAGCFATALMLSGEFMVLIQSGYTTEASALKAMTFVANAVTVSRARAVVEARTVTEGAIPVGKIERDLDDRPLETKVASLVRLWHTPWTRLQRIEWEEGSLWSTGEKVQGKPVVEIRD